MSTVSDKHQSPPAVEKKSGWDDIDLPFNIGSGRTLYAGLEGANRLRMRLFKDRSTGNIVGRAWFGPGSDGPPGHVHGGSIAYVLDEVMGSVCWGNDFPTVAASLQFQYVRMTPLLLDLEVEAKIKATTAKRVSVEAELRLANGEVFVRGQGEFAILTYAKGEALSKIVPEAASIISRPQLKWAKDDAS
jgi:acyl-coenzyme A thioesterase PaaI-like protein